MNPDVLGLVLLALLLVINAYFVAAEFAVISARRSQIEPRADRGSSAARTTLWAMEHATLMLATTQLGITVCSLLILNVSEPAITHLLGDPLQALGLGHSAMAVTSFVVAVVVVSFCHVVIGEMVPKNLSFARPVRAALVLAPPLVLLGRLLKPVVVALNATANGVLRLFRVQPQEEATSTYTLDQVATIVRQSEAAGTITDASGRLDAALAFTTRTVAEVAVGIGRVVTLGPEPTPAGLRRLVVEHGYSRYVITDPSGVPVGYLHLKDILDLDGRRQWDEPVPPARIRPVIRLPHNADADDALQAMQLRKAHLALSVDEVGTVTGVVFLEDLLEELVGRIDDTTSTG